MWNKIKNFFTGKNITDTFPENIDESTEEVIDIKEFQERGLDIGKYYIYKCTKQGFYFYSKGQPTLFISTEELLETYTDDTLTISTPNSKLKTSLKRYMGSLADRDLVVDRRMYSLNWLQQGRSK